MRPTRQFFVSLSGTAAPARFCPAFFETKLNPIQGSVNISGALLSIGREAVNWP
jgi:hypothetical protein